MSEVALPENWVEAKFREVATLKTGPFGSALHKSDYEKSGVPVINPTHIRDGKVVPSSVVTVSQTIAERLSDYRLIANDVIMGRRGEMGRCALVTASEQGWLCGTGSVIVRPNKRISPKYLQRFLTSPATVMRLNGDSVGSTMVNLNQGVVFGLDVPLPPLAEQERIADKLDTVFARVNACRERLDQVPQILKRFRQSVLNAATSGALTADWRNRRISTTSQPLERSASSFPWKPVSMGQKDICEAIFDGPFGSKLKSNDYVAQGERVVRLENIKHLKFDTSKESYVSKEKYEDLARNALLPGDVMFSSFVDEEVRVCQLPVGLPTKAINKADCFCIRTNEKLLAAKFLMYRLACKSTYSSLKAQVHGATRPRINLGQLRSFEFGLPTIDEQQEIIRRIEKLFAFADRMEIHLSTARGATERLIPALLAKAFRGELVPQDHNDEPASELLKRVAVSRATEGGQVSQ